MTPVLAIDPGASGGLAWREADGIVYAEKMPEGMTAQVDKLREFACEGCTAAIIEKTGTWFKGDHPSAACKFARHCGQIEAALYALGIPFEEVAPGVWMRSMGTLPKVKQARKNAIKEEMARRYPHLKVILGTADALGILTWYINKKEDSR